MTDAEMFVSILTYAGDPHTFRIGSIVATIGGFHSEENSFTVDYVNATFAGETIFTDTPYLYVDAPMQSDPLLTAHQMIAETIRHNGGL